MVGITHCWRGSGNSPRAGATSARAEGDRRRISRRAFVRRRTGDRLADGGAVGSRAALSHSVAARLQSVGRRSASRRDSRPRRGGAFRIGLPPVSWTPRQGVHWTPGQAMRRGNFYREFKIEGVRLARERGAGVVGFRPPRGRSSRIGEGGCSAPRFLPRFAAMRLTSASVRGFASPRRASPPACRCFR